MVSFCIWMLSVIFLAYFEADEEGEGHGHENQQPAEDC